MPTGPQTFEEAVDGLRKSNPTSRTQAMSRARPAPAAVASSSARVPTTSPRRCTARRSTTNEQEFEMAVAGAQLQRGCSTTGDAPRLAREPRLIEAYRRG